MTVLGIVLVILGIILLAAAYKQRNSTITHTSLAGVNEFEDFLNSTNGTAYTTSVANAGSVSQGQLANRSTLVKMVATADSDVATMKTGSTTFVLTTGEVLTISSDIALFGSGPPHTRFIFGLLNITAPVDIFQAGAFFMADISVSNNWVCVRTDSSGTSNQTVTNVPVSLTSSGLVGDFQRLKLISLNDRSLFFIDGNLVANISNTWDQATVMNILADLRTSGGTADITSVYIDYISTVFQLATPRLPA